MFLIVSGSIKGWRLGTMKWWLHVTNTWPPNRQNIQPPAMRHWWIFHGLFKSRLTSVDAIGQNRPAIQRNDSKCVPKHTKRIASINPSIQQTNIRQSDLWENELHESMFGFVYAENCTAHIRFNMLIPQKKGWTLTSNLYRYHAFRINANITV